MKFKTVFAFVLGAGVGSAVTYFIFQRNKNKEIEALMEKEWGERTENGAKEALEDYSEVTSNVDIS